MTDTVLPDTIPTSLLQDSVATSPITEFSKLVNQATEHITQMNDKIEQFGKQLEQNIKQATTIATPPTNTTLTADEVRAHREDPLYQELCDIINRSDDPNVKSYFSGMGSPRIW